MDPTPSSSKVIVSKTFINKIANVYASSRMNFGSDTVLSESPNFVDFELSSVNTTDDLRSVFFPNTIIGMPIDVFNWLPSGHEMSEVTADRVSGTNAKNHCNF